MEDRASVIQAAQRLQSKFSPITEVGILDGDYTKEDLVCIEELLAQAHNASRWGSIDLARIYADRMDDALRKRKVTREERNALVMEHHGRIAEKFGIKIGSLQTYVSVARKWDIDRRLPVLTLAHYQAVDSLPLGNGPEAERHREEILQAAYDQFLTVREMNAMAADTRYPALSILNGDNDQGPTCPERTVYDYATNWIQQHDVGGLSWDKPNRLVLRSAGNGAALILISDTPITIEKE